MWRVSLLKDGAMLVQHRPSGRGRWLVWTQVRPSKLHGKGLFADRTFRPRDCIGDYDGLEVAEECVLAYESDMVLKLCEPRVRFVDGQYGRSGLVQFANHSGGEGLNATVWPSGRMEATVQIERGQEILWDYGAEFWEG